VARLAGDPTRTQWLRYAVGGRLPDSCRDWVRHDLTDSGWQLRLLGRVLLQLSPFVVGCLVVPGIDGLARGLLVALLVCSMLITIGAAAEQVRDRRLRQHGLPVPGERPHCPTDPPHQR
jgi:hypothetical protein